MIECPFDIRINDPHLARLWLRDGEDLLNGIMTAPAWAKPVAGRLKLSLPARLQRILDACLEAAIKDSRNAKGPELTVGFGKDTRLVGCAFQG